MSNRDIPSFYSYSRLPALDILHRRVSLKQNFTIVFPEHKLSRIASSTMCHLCIPGLHHAAQAAVEEVDPNELAPPSESGGALECSKDVTIFTGCSILTMAGGRLSPVDALTVKDGKVIAVGGLKEAVKLAGPHRTTIHLPENYSILPGFIDNHVHILHTALIENFYLDVGTTAANTLQKVLDLLKQNASEKKDKDEWVTGFGYDPSLVEGNEELTREDLDTVSTDHPIFVIAQNQHLGYVNSKALSLGVTDSHPADDTYKKDKDGNFTGVILETAVSYFAGLAPKPKAEDLAGWVKKTLNSWAKSGCTTVFDAAIGIIAGAKDFTLLKKLTADPNQPLRLIGALYNLAIPDFADLLAPPPVYIGITKVPAIKFITDGSTQGLTAAVRDPYLNGNGSSGHLNYKNEDLKASMSYYLKKGWQLIIHCNGDAASEQALGIFEDIFKDTPDRDTSILHRIEHFTVTSPDQVAKAQRLGLGVCHTMSHVWNWGAAFEDWVLGKERGSRIDPVGDDVKLGVTYAFNADAPLVPVNPLQDAQGAFSRKVKGTERVIGKEQAVDLEQALRGITTNAAKLLMMEDTIGSLEVGKSADLVILDRNPCGLADLTEIKVLETWLQGSRVFQCE